MKVLITAGGCREWIDKVRFIGNFSSGKTACRIAAVFTKAGHQVYLLAAKSMKQSPPPLKSLFYFDDFSSLEQGLKNLLQENDFDMLIHVAAVSDYSVDKVLFPGLDEAEKLPGKISSTGEINIKLKPNPKLISRLKDYSRNPQMILVGFKLTVNAKAEARMQALRKIFEQSKADFIVANDLSEISREKHLSLIYNQKLECLFKGNSKQDLARNLLLVAQSKGC